VTGSVVKIRKNDTTSNVNVVADERDLETFGYNQTQQDGYKR